MPKQPSLPTNTVPVAEGDRKGFAFRAPFNLAGMPVTTNATWQEWAEYHKELGQELAKRMREHGGPAEQDEPPPGGTPVLMRQAA